MWDSAPISHNLTDTIVDGCHTMFAINDFYMVFPITGYSSIDTSSEAVLFFGSLWNDTQVGISSCISTMNAIVNSCTSTLPTTKMLYTMEGCYINVTGHAETCIEYLGTFSQGDIPNL